MSDRGGSERERLRAIVRGRVQGVGFRASTVREAERLGIVGEVRNRADGAVEIVAEGDLGSLAALLAWLERGGPRHARVDGVETTRDAATGEFVDFRIRW